MTDLSCKSRLRTVVWQARRLVGARFNPHGREPGVMDCGGVLLAYRRAGYRIGDLGPADYDVVPDPGVLLGAIRKDGREVPLPDIVPGCLLVMWLVNRCRPQHVGVYVGDQRIVHVLHDRGCVEDPLAPVWERRLVSAWLPKEEPWLR